MRSTPFARPTKDELSSLGIRGGRVFGVPGCFGRFMSLGGSSVDEASAGEMGPNELVKITLRQSRKKKVEEKTSRTRILSSFDWCS